MIHEKIVKNFYTNRHKFLGNDIKSIGWGSKKNQILRFKILLKKINLKNKTILDYGCGFSDLYIYLKKNKKYNFKYYGFDIVKEFIKINKKKFDKIKYFNNQKNVFNNCFDYIACSGVFTYKTKQSKKYFFLKSRQLLKIANKGLFMNFLSSKSKIKLKKNLYYTEKEVIGNFAKIKNIRIKLINSYNLDEFTIQLIKK